MLESLNNADPDSLSVFIAATNPTEAGDDDSIAGFFFSENAGLPWVADRLFDTDADLLDPSKEFSVERAVELAEVLEIKFDR